MSKSRTATLFVVVLLILFPSPPASADDVDAGTECPSLPELYVYVSDVPYGTKVNGKVNLYGKSCVDVKSGDVAAQGTCYAPGDCRAKLCDGKPCALPTANQLKTSQQSLQPSATAPTTPVSTSFVAPSLNPISSNNSFLDQMMFHPNSLTPNPQTFSPSGQQVNDFLQSTQGYPAPTILQTVSNPSPGLPSEYLAPTPSANSINQLQGGTFESIPTNPVQTTAEPPFFHQTSTFRPSDVESTQNQNSFFRDLYDTVSKKVNNFLSEIGSTYYQSEPVSQPAGSFDEAGFTTGDLTKSLDLPATKVIAGENLDITSGNPAPGELTREFFADRDKTTATLLAGLDTNRQTFDTADQRLTATQQDMQAFIDRTDPDVTLKDGKPVYSFSSQDDVNTFNKLRDNLVQASDIYNQERNTLTDRLNELRNYQDQSEEQFAKIPAQDRFIYSTDNTITSLGAEKSINERQIDDLRAQIRDKYGGYSGNFIFNTPEYKALLALQDRNIVIDGQVSGLQRISTGVYNNPALADTLTSPDSTPAERTLAQSLAEQWSQATPGDKRDLIDSQIQQLGLPASERNVDMQKTLAAMDADKPWYLKAADLLTTSPVHPSLEGRITASISNAIPEVINSAASLGRLADLTSAQPSRLAAELTMTSTERAIAYGVDVVNVAATADILTGGKITGALVSGLRYGAEVIAGVNTGIETTARVSTIVSEDAVRISPVGVTPVQTFGDVVADRTGNVVSADFNAAVRRTTSVLDEPVTAPVINLAEVRAARAIPEPTGPGASVVADNVTVTADAVGGRVIQPVGSEALRPTGQLVTPANDSSLQVGSVEIQGNTALKPSLEPPISTSIEANSLDRWVSWNKNLELTLANDNALGPISATPFAPGWGPSSALLASVINQTAPDTIPSDTNALTVPPANISSPPAPLSLAETGFPQVLPGTVPPSPVPVTPVTSSPLPEASPPPSPSGLPEEVPGRAPAPQTGTSAPAPAVTVIDYIRENFGDLAAQRARESLYLYGDPWAGLLSGAGGVGEAASSLSTSNPPASPTQNPPLVQVSASAPQPSLVPQSDLLRRVAQGILTAVSPKVEQPSLSIVPKWWETELAGTPVVRNAVLPSNTRLVETVVEEVSVSGSAIPENAVVPSSVWSPFTSGSAARAAVLAVGLINAPLSPLVSEAEARPGTRSVTSCLSDWTCLRPETGPASLYALNNNGLNGGPKTASGYQPGPQDMLIASQTYPFGTFGKLCNGSRCVYAFVGDTGDFNQAKYRYTKFDLLPQVSNRIGPSPSQGKITMTFTPLGVAPVSVAAAVTRALNAGAVLPDAVEQSKGKVLAYAPGISPAGAPATVVAANIPPVSSTATTPAPAPTPATVVPVAPPSVPPVSSPVLVSSPLAPAPTVAAAPSPETLALQNSVTQSQIRVDAIAKNIAALQANLAALDSAKNTLTRAAANAKTTQDTGKALTYTNQAVAAGARLVNPIENIARAAGDAQILKSAQALAAQRKVIAPQIFQAVGIYKQTQSRIALLPYAGLQKTVPPLLTEANSLIARAQQLGNSTLVSLQQQKTKLTTDLGKAKQQLADAQEKQNQLVAAATPPPVPEIVPETQVAVALPTEPAPEVYTSADIVAALNGGWAIASERDVAAVVTDNTVATLAVIAVAPTPTPALEATLPAVGASPKPEPTVIAENVPPPTPASVTTPSPVAPSVQSSVTATLVVPQVPTLVQYTFAGLAYAPPVPVSLARSNSFAIRPREPETQAGTGGAQPEPAAPPKPLPPPPTATEALAARENYLQDPITSTDAFKEFPRLPLSGADAQLQEAAIAKYISEKGTLFEDYTIHFGSKVVNPDLARLLFRDIGYNGTNSAAVQKVVADMTDELWHRALAANPEQYAVIYTGSAGAGKSTTVQAVLPSITSDTAAVLDGTLSNPIVAQQRIDEALAAGKSVQIVNIYRDPIDAWNNGVISRMNGTSVDAGRVVPISVFVVGYKRSLDIVKSLLANPNPRITVTLIDNSKGAGNATLMSLNDFRAITYSKGIERTIRDDTKSLLDNGVINAEQYAAITGSEAPAKLAVLSTEPVVPLDVEISLPERAPSPVAVIPAWYAEWSAFGQMAQQSMIFALATPSQTPVPTAVENMVPFFAQRQFILNPETLVDATPYGQTPQQFAQDLIVQARNIEPATLPTNIVAPSGEPEAGAPTASSVPASPPSPEPVPSVSTEPSVPEPSNAASNIVPFPILKAPPLANAPETVTESTASTPSPAPIASEISSPSVPAELTTPQTTGQVLRVLRGAILPGNLSLNPLFGFGLVWNGALNTASYLIAGPAMPVLNMGYRYVVNSAYRADVKSLFGRLTGSSQASPASAPTPAVNPNPVTTPSLTAPELSREQLEILMGQPLTDVETRSLGYTATNDVEAYSRGQLETLMGRPMTDVEAKQYGYIQSGPTSPWAAPGSVSRVRVLGALGIGGAALGGIGFYAWDSGSWKIGGGPGSGPPSPPGGPLSPPPPGQGPPATPTTPSTPSGQPPANPPSVSQASAKENAESPIAQTTPLPPTTSQAPPKETVKQTEKVPPTQKPPAKPVDTNTPSGPGATTQTPGSPQASPSGSALGKLGNLLGGLFASLMRALGLQPAVPSTPVQPTPTPQSASAKLTANPVSVAMGSTTALSWTSVGTSRCTLFSDSGVPLGQGDSVGATSSLPLATTTIFVLNCSTISATTVFATTSVTVPATTSAAQ